LSIDHADWSIHRWRWAKMPGCNDLVLACFGVFAIVMLLVTFCLHTTTALEGRLHTAQAKV
jgi:hypothetical protein